MNNDLFNDEINNIVKIEPNFNDISNKIEYKTNKNYKKNYRWYLCFSLVLVIIIGITIPIINFTASVNSNLNPNYENLGYDNTAVSSIMKRKQLNSFTDDNPNYSTFQDKLRSFSYKISEEYYNNINNTDNLCMSPLSIYMALSMLSEATYGNSRNEILNALCMEYSDISDNTSTLIYSSIKGPIFDEKKTNICQFDINNSLWLSTDQYKEDCIANLTNNYYVDSFKIDFQKYNKIANETLSKYVSDKTNGLIKKEFQFNELTNFILMNTIYLKDIWGNNELLFTNSKYNFKNGDNTTNDIFLLSSNYCSGLEYAGSIFKMFESYTEHGYKIKFLVPNDGVNVSNLLKKEILEEAMNASYIYSDDNYEYYSRCLFPAFKVTSKEDNDIIPVLKKLGINELFYNADFSSLTDIPLNVSILQHQAVLDVNEKGIEGAIVTMSSFESCGTPSNKELKYLDFIINKAFVYILTDKNDNIIFTGCVNKIY